MLYRTNCALIIKGDRVAKGKEVELEPAVAANFGDDLSPANDAIEEVAPIEDAPAVADMSVAELKARAESLGISKSGSKAALQERITLAEAGGAATEEEEELADDNQ